MPSNEKSLALPKSITDMVQAAIPGIDCVSMKKLVHRLQELGLHDEYLWGSVYVNDDQIIDILSPIELQLFKKFVRDSKHYLKYISSVLRLTIS